MLYNTLMKTDFDVLSADGWLQPKVKEGLDRAVVINVDNIAEYFYSESSQEYWDVGEDFPNLAPPFQHFWMEYKMPTFSNSEGVIKTLPYQIRGMRFGALFHAEETEKHIKDPQQLTKTDCKWSMMVILFTEKNGKLLQCGRFCTQYGIKPDGKLGHYEGKQAILVGFNKNDYADLPDHLRPNFEKEIDQAKSFFNPMLLAISFLHCKNVKMVHTLPQSRKHKGQAQKPPKIKVYTLEIEPMRKILEAEGQSQKTGLKKALHICRGHFKDFSQGAGLFGKYKGLFWWDSQLRGNAKYGRVDKDYSISGPNEA